MKVVYSRRAVDDLTEIANYLRPLDPRAAARVSSAIRASVRRIARHPFSGRLQDDGSRKVVVVPYGYLIFYDPREARIEIAAIRHGARERPVQDA